ncbi:MAG: hypothetical protein ACI9NN_001637 [Bacteroidia bacterium]|jgi:hypothetical protein
MLALIGGLLFESLRISRNWKDVGIAFTAAYVMSLMAFIPEGRGHIYNFEENIESWPYWFLITFTLFMAIWQEQKVTAKLTEGITLLLSLSILYWILDYGYDNVSNRFAHALLILALALAIFSIVHALTYLKLSNAARLTLSIWSSLIMMVLAVDNIYRVFQNEIEEGGSQGLYLGLQYFLVGVSAIYVMQNYILLASLLPQNGEHYRASLKEGSKKHLVRYAEMQVHRSHTLLCLAYALVLYGINYFYKLLPRHTMIWLVILSFPLILKLYGLLHQKSTSFNKE